MGYLLRFFPGGRCGCRGKRSVMEERLRFVARLLDGEAMTDVCREFGVSRKTGYKIFDRYKEHGLEALSDRSRRPVRYADQLPDQIEGVPVVNQIRIYWWCSPPRTGRQRMCPVRSTARETGVSFSKDRCVRTSL